MKTPGNSRSSAPASCASSGTTCRAARTWRPGREAVLLSLPVAYWFGFVTLAQLFVVALLTGAGQVLFSAAYPAFFVSPVDRSRYVEANSKLSMSRSASFVAGPALGGLLIQIMTAPVAMLVDALLSSLRRPRRSPRSA